MFTGWQVVCHFQPEMALAMAAPGDGRAPLASALDFEDTPRSQSST
jgi:hypothetical protein